jgi:uncharacterized protein (DUF433 family)
MVAVALKTITAKLSNREFTVSEAAGMLGLGVTEVNNLVDEIAPLGVARAGGGKRAVTYRGLFALLVAKELIYCQLNPDMRPETIKRALKVSGRRVQIPGTNLEVLVDSYRKQVNKGLRSLYEAENAVESDPEVMQGEPCVRGTRVPVYTVGAIAARKGVDEALSAYPFLSKRSVELAAIYVGAHPRRGRPKAVVIPTKPHKVRKKAVGNLKG